MQIFPSFVISFCVYLLTAFSVVVMDNAFNIFKFVGCILNIYRPYQPQGDFALLLPLLVIVKIAIFL